MKTNQSKLKQAVEAMAANQDGSNLAPVKNSHNYTGYLDKIGTFSMLTMDSQMSQPAYTTAQALRIQHQTLVQAATDTLIFLLNTCTTNQLEAIVEAHSEVMYSFDDSADTYQLMGIVKDGKEYILEFSDTILGVNLLQKYPQELNITQTCDLIQTIESVL